MAIRLYSSIWKEKIKNPNNIPLDKAKFTLTTVEYITKKSASEKGLVYSVTMSESTAKLVFDVSKADKWLQQLLEVLTNRP